MVLKIPQLHLIFSYGSLHISISYCVEPLRRQFYKAPDFKYLHRVSLIVSRSGSCQWDGSQFGAVTGWPFLPSPPQTLTLLNLLARQLVGRSKVLWVGCCSSLSIGSPSWLREVVTLVTISSTARSLSYSHPHRFPSVSLHSRSLTYPSNCSPSPISLLSFFLACFSFFPSPLLPSSLPPTTINISFTFPYDEDSSIFPWAHVVISLLLVCYHSMVKVCCMANINL